MMHLYSAFIVYCHTPKALYSHEGGHSSTTTSLLRTNLSFTFRQQISSPWTCINGHTFARDISPTLHILHLNTVHSMMLSGVRPYMAENFYHVLSVCSLFTLVLWTLIYFIIFAYYIYISVYVWMCTFMLWVNCTLPAAFMQTLCHTLQISLKGIVHFEIKIWYVSAYPKGIQDVGVFFSSVDPILMFLGQTVLVCQSYNGRYRSLSLWEGKRTCTEKFKLNNSPS